MAVKFPESLLPYPLFSALMSGNMQALSAAPVAGCSKAVTLTLSLLGMMCLWSGIMRAAGALGVLQKLSKLLSPLLKRIFPDAWKKGRGISEISAAIIANILGIGNAATPLAVGAMKALSDGKSDIATDDMVTFTVLGTAFPSLIPTTVIALRASAGSENPFVFFPPYGCSFLSVIVCHSSFADDATEVANLKHEIAGSIGYVDFQDDFLNGKAKMKEYG